MVRVQKGLLKINPSTNEVISVGDKNSKINPFLNYEIFSLFADKKNNIWIGTINGGLYSLNLDNNALAHHSYTKLDNFSISSNSISTIFETKNGDMLLVLIRAG
ncbi:MAG: hypothetical protein IPO21_21250 [Bacteroidales bacterium]|nr:hypothetical protein [Bacteroidales bacterium]